MAFPTRRIVTGHDAAGRAVVDSDQLLDAQPAGDDGARVESGLAAAHL
jgi:hypothetical protein